MEIKNYSLLKANEKKAIINKYSFLMECCSAYECDECQFYHENYINLPESVFHGHGMTCGRLYNMMKKECEKGDED